ncbi:hypothetical protein OHS70_37530 [Streptomyces sp. NBC_00390]|uniref:hypothetical protein n=1 Tax=Streptomyces sp. NBC_00390 TaxID=2975736 RepID=UPI002E1F6206
MVSDVGPDGGVHLGERAGAGAVRWSAVSGAYVAWPRHATYEHGSVRVGGELGGRHDVRREFVGVDPGGHRPARTVLPADAGVFRRTPPVQ